MFLWYEDILVGEIITNQTLTVDEALKRLEFDEEKFIAEYEFDDVDYNEFFLTFTA